MPEWVTKLRPDMKPRLVDQSRAGLETVPATVEYEELSLADGYFLVQIQPNGEQFSPVLLQMGGPVERVGDRERVFRAKEDAKQEAVRAFKAKLEHAIEDIDQLLAGEVRFTWSATPEQVKDFFRWVEEQGVHTWAEFIDADKEDVRVDIYIPDDILQTYIAEQKVPTEVGEMIS